MKLGIPERLVFSMLFPEKGNLITQTLVKDIAKRVEITQKEMKKIEFIAVSQNQFRWNKEKAKDLDIDFTKAELEFLKQQVDRLDREKKITQDILDLCLKIKTLKSSTEE